MKFEDALGPAQPAFTDEPKPEKPFTVIGFWFEDEPLVAGIIEGNVAAIWGGEDLQDGDGRGFQGPWSGTWEAKDADAAGVLAVAHMNMTRDCGDEEENA